MIPHEQFEALSIAMKGYRSPPRQIQPVMAEDFIGISPETMGVLVKNGLLLKKRISFSGEQQFDAYIITAKGAKLYSTMSGDDEDDDD